jgi:hypothetical protein
MGEGPGGSIMQPANAVTPASVVKVASVRAGRSSEKEMLMFGLDQSDT